METAKTTSTEPVRDDSSIMELGATQDEMDLIPLKKLFEVEGSSQDKNLETILGWAQNKGITNRDDMRLELRRIEMKLGAPNLGESRTARLARYLILDGRMNNTLKEMETYER